VVNTSSAVDCPLVTPALPPEGMLLVARICWQTPVDAPLTPDNVTFCKLSLQEQRCFAPAVPQSSGKISPCLRVTATFFPFLRLMQPIAVELEVEKQPPVK